MGKYFYQFQLSLLGPGNPTAQCFYRRIFGKSVHNETTSLDTWDEDYIVVEVPLPSVACDDENIFIDTYNSNADTV